MNQSRTHHMSLLYEYGAFWHSSGDNMNGVPAGRKKIGGCNRGSRVGLRLADAGGYHDLMTMRRHHTVCATHR